MYVLTLGSQPNIYSSVHPITHELKHLRRLRDLRFSGHLGAHNVPNLRDNFLLQSRLGSHMCTVTDLLGYDLQSIALTQFHGRRQTCTFPEEAAKAVARSLLTALDYCHSECGIIHTGRLVWLMLTFITDEIDRRQNSQRNVKARTRYLGVDSQGVVHRNGQENVHLRRRYRTARNNMRRIPSWLLPVT